MYWLDNCTCSGIFDNIDSNTSVSLQICRMDKYEVGSLVALVLVYKIIILLIILYEIAKCKRSEMQGFFTIKGNYTP